MRSSELSGELANVATAWWSTSGVVDLSQPDRTKFPGSAGLDRRRRAGGGARSRRRPRAGSCARRSHAAAAGPGAGKDLVHRRQLRGSQRRIQRQFRPAEISEPVRPQPVLGGRVRPADREAQNIRAAGLRGRARHRDRQGGPAHPARAGLRAHLRHDAVQRRQRARLAAPRQVQRHAGQEFRPLRQRRAVDRHVPTNAIRAGRTRSSPASMARCARAIPPSG